MALTEDQRAMLQLLLEGGQSYDDIAGLLGSDAGGIRTRAREALTEIGGTDPDAEVGMTDYLLGQADPIGRADAARQLQNDPAANDHARRLCSQLRLLAPRASLPEIPEPRGRGSAPPPAAPPPPATATPTSSPGTGLPSPPPPAAPAASRGPGAMTRLRETLSGAGEGIGSLSGRQSRLLFGLGAAAILVLAVVLAVTLFSGDDGSSQDSAAVPSGAGQDVVVVPLQPLDPGSNANGQAVIAQPGDQGQVQINLEGLEPSRGSDVYVAWLYTNQVAYPLGFFRANRQGSFSGPAPIPAQTVQLVRSFGCIDVSKVAGERVVNDLRQAIRTGTLPGHDGSSIVRGEIRDPGQEAIGGPDSDCRGSLPTGTGATGAAGAGTAGGSAGNTQTSP
ncbi:MAG: hypothetical protein EXQ70_07770 [Solirubrobacterales bacterium]|nr:hypothetical protein [Solirubrobacterales bacterium]